MLRRHGSIVEVKPRLRCGRLARGVGHLAEWGRCGGSVGSPWLEGATLTRYVSIDSGRRRCIARVTREQPPRARVVVERTRCACLSGKRGRLQAYAEPPGCRTPLALRLGRWADEERMARSGRLGTARRASHSHEIEHGQGDGRSSSRSSRSLGRQLGARTLMALMARWPPSCGLSIGPCG
jgi:hypothetical protein